MDLSVSTRVAGGENSVLSCDTVNDMPNRFLEQKPISFPLCKVVDTSLVQLS